jgi:hypothetical protein
VIFGGGRIALEGLGLTSSVSLLALKLAMAESAARQTGVEMAEAVQAVEAAFSAHLAEEPKMSSTLAILAEAVDRIRS